MYDIIIKNGTIYDGTGNAPFAADIGIMDGKIVSDRGKEEISGENK